MGYQNSAAIWQYWGHLDLAPRMLLLHMADVARDVDTPDGPGQTYWGSWRLQAQAMGYSSKSGQRYTRKLRQRLVEAGALELVEPGRKGRSPVWHVVTVPARPVESAPWDWLGGTPRT